MNRLRIHNKGNTMSILSAGAVLSKILLDVNEDGASLKTLHETLGSKEVGLMRARGSAMKLLGKYIVEPVIVISNELYNSEDLDAALSLHIDLFTATYMQLFDIITASYGVGANTAVDLISTDRGGVERLAMGGLKLASENNVLTGVTPIDLLFQDGSIGNEAGKPKSGDSDTDDITITPGEQALYDAGLAYGREQGLEQGRKEGKKKAKSKKSKKPKKHTIHNFKVAGAKADLVIPNILQRRIEIVVEQSLPARVADGKKEAREATDLTVTIPVTIKLSAIFTTPENIVNAISPGHAKHSLSNRLDDFRASSISATEFFFATDLIKKYKKNKLKDKEGLLKLLQSRKISANSKVVDQGIIGFEKYYTMYILSKDTKTIVENSLGGKLSKPKYKDDFLEAGYGLSVSIMDEDAERMTVYMKDLRGSSKLSYRAMSKNSKSGGGDVTELMKAIMAGKPPVY